VSREESQKISPPMLFSKSNKKFVLLLYKVDVSVSDWKCIYVHLSKYIYDVIDKSCRTFCGGDLDISKKVQLVNCQIWIFLFLLSLCSFLFFISSNQIIFIHSKIFQNMESYLKFQEKVDIREKRSISELLFVNHS
jgi:hypothetical protein